VYDRRGIRAVAMEAGGGRAGGGRGRALQRGELGRPGVDRDGSVVARYGEGGEGARCCTEDRSTRVTD